MSISLVPVFVWRGVEEDCFLQVQIELHTIIKPLKCSAATAISSILRYHLSPGSTLFPYILFGASLYNIFERVLLVRALLKIYYYYYYSLIRLLMYSFANTRCDICFFSFIFMSSILLCKHFHGTMTPISL